MKSHSVAMLGTGLIGDFYTMTLHGQRNRDSVGVVYSRTQERADAFADRWGIPTTTTSMHDAINHPDVDTSLKNIAALYRATKRKKVAVTLEKARRPHKIRQSMSL